MSKSNDVKIGSSGLEAWQDEYDGAYQDGFRQSWLAERDRLGRIFCSPEAAGEGRLEAAQVMAFNSEMSVEQVIAVLEATNRSDATRAIARAWSAVHGATCAVENSGLLQGRPTAGSLN